MQYMAGYLVTMSTNEHWERQILHAKSGLNVLAAQTSDFGLFAGLSRSRAHATFLGETERTWNSIQYAVLNQIDLSYMVCERPVVDLCQHYFIPFWPLLFPITRIFRNGRAFPFFYSGAPQKIVSAYFPPDYHTALDLSSWPLIA